MSEPVLDVILCWHMHQPQYRSAIDGNFRLPWTYLHAIKDYSDMAWHLEAVPGAKAVVNFTPVVVEQLADYGAQFSTGEFRDPLLRALASAGRIAAGIDREQLRAALFRANQERMIDRFAPYSRLQHFARMAADHEASYFSEQYFADLLVWYHLAWIGESVRRSDERVTRLMEKSSGYTHADCNELLGVMRGIIAGIIPRYRALAESGTIELSTTPYEHPIVPLLLDFAAARETMRDAPLPSAAAYPGGSERAQAQLRQALAYHRAVFGASPVGCWPSEGGISQRAAEMFAEHGFRWTASGENVLVHSLRARAELPHDRSEYLYQPYRAGSGRGSLACFFRDDRLSDLIGFEYARWHADDAVANFVHALENIRRATASQDAPVVTVVLDGENPWENYVDNGYHFLAALYDALVGAPHFRLTTFSEHLDRRATMPSVDPVVAGSWVYGTFSAWIGDADKNRAWDLLVAAKDEFDRAMTSGRLDGQNARRAAAQLSVCEGSDWFWWPGDYNPAQAVSDFDRLFREHLRALYLLLGVAPTTALDAVISRGGGHPVSGGVMRPTADPSQPS